MKRRRFLQLAASVAAGAGVIQAAGLPAFRREQCLLRMKLLQLEPAAGKFPGATLIAFHAEPAATTNAMAAIQHAAEHPLTRLPFPTRSHAMQEDAVLIELMLERLPGAQSVVNHWIVDGQSLSQQAPLPLTPGRRYRLRWINATRDAHLIHLQDHSFQITRAQQQAIEPLYTNTIHLARYAVVDADVVVREPGNQVS